MKMEMEKAKDTQRASEETDNLVHFKCQAIGKEIERGKERDVEREEERQSE